MDREAQWIDSTDTLSEVLEGLGAGPLALDTEADSLHHYPEKVCLIQLSFGERDFLLDPLADLSLEPLGERLADPSILKILHGADYDLRMLHRGFGVTFAGLFDTMIASRFTGETRFGLAALLEKYFDVEMDKRFQRADWSLRPLTPEMSRYAAMDTQYLIRLYRALDADLVRLGRRSWAEEEFERLQQIRSAEPNKSEGFRRVKGSGKLERGKLAVLREVWALREAWAVRLDRPPFRVLHDERLIDLCQRLPQRTEDLAAISRLPRPWRDGRRARELLEAIRRGAAVPAEDWPARSRGARSQRGAKVVSPRLDGIRRHRDRVAADLQLDPALLGPRAVLEDIALRLDAGGDPQDSPDLRRWQWSLLAAGVEESPPGDPSF